MIHLPANTKHRHNVGSMLGSIVDGGPTLDQHWVDVSCLLGYLTCIKAIDHSMYISGFSCTPIVSNLCNQRGAFWVQMCPTVRTQWTTSLKNRSLISPTVDNVCFYQ